MLFFTGALWQKNRLREWLNLADKCHRAINRYSKTGQATVMCVMHVTHFSVFGVAPSRPICRILVNGLKPVSTTKITQKVKRNASNPRANQVVSIGTQAPIG